MKKNFFIIIMAGLFFLAGCAKESYFVEVPKDFKIIAVAGGVAPGTTVDKVEIDSQGRAVYSQMSANNRSKGLFEEKEKFQLSVPDLRDIYRTAKKNNFFNLNEKYKNDNILDGSFAELTITAEGITHSVRTQNTSVEGFDKIMISINLATPGMNKVIYNAILK